MARKDKHVSETPATQVLRGAGVSFTEHVYDYVDHGGTGESSRQLGVSEHEVVKTLVMQDDRAQPLIVLMHGDCQVSTKNLARAIGVKGVEPCKPEVAQRHSGYLVGGTSPFGTPQAHARLRRSQRARAAAHPHQRRTARLPPGYRAIGADQDAGEPDRCSARFDPRFRAASSTAA
jgi:Cys-tRNA(Pro) deacylase